MNGLVGCYECGKTNETFLCSTARGFTIADEQAFEVKRVNAQALVIFLILLTGERLRKIIGKENYKKIGSDSQQPIIFVEKAAL